LESRDVTLDDVYGELERRMETTANGQNNRKAASV
jgi:phosphoribosyl-ATP pyrophosphohydrolase